MGQVNKKLKLVWICHFSNQEIRSRLPLANYYLKNFFKKTLGDKSQTVHADFAPWVTNLINSFEKFESVELHVISPHYGLKKKLVEFSLRGVHYHIFKPDMPFLHVDWPAIFRNYAAPNFYFNRQLVKKLIGKITPDVVNLIGTENPYYSITALDLEGVPVMAMAQTVYSNPDRMRLSGSLDKFRWDTEIQLYQKIQYYGCTGRMHNDLIKKNNPNAIIFKTFFPIQQPAKVEDVPKEADFVFFAAGVTPKKGIEDALEALALVKKSHEKVSMYVVGTCAPNYKNFLLQKIERLGISKNIFFKDYFPVHADMHQFIVKAKIAVLPNKLDIISGTVIEAMLLGLPLVTSKTTGTPYLNKNGDTVLISEIGDIESLSKHMIKLLNDPEFANDLSVRAKAFVVREFDNRKSAEQLLATLRAISKHYHQKMPIPKELLFDLEEFPIY
jgi:glycosyltransferase involved in cell wall biosynthesis